MCWIPTRVRLKSDNVGKIMWKCYVWIPLIRFTSDNMTINGEKVTFKICFLVILCVGYWRVRLKSDKVGKIMWKCYVLDTAHMVQILRHDHKWGKSYFQNMIFGRAVHYSLELIFLQLGQLVYYVLDTAHTV